MALKHLSEFKNLLGKKQRKRLVLAAAEDLNALSAVMKAGVDGIIEPILVGDKDELVKLAAENNFDLSNIRMVHEPDPNQATEIAVKMVRSGQAEVLMKGNVGTSTLLKAVLNKEWGLRSGSLLSHIAFFEIKNYHKIIAVTDVAMNIEPNLQEKIAIVNNSVGCLNRLGYDMPKVAILGAVEKVNENMRATLDAALMSKMNQRDQIEHCIIDGPLAFDNAVSLESAIHKGIKSEIAGDTDLLVMPDIEVGNVLYKSLVFFADAKVAAVILGATAPIVLTSRSDSDEAKYDSIMLAAAISK
jgi:phosphate butyryltransferase